MSVQVNKSQTDLVFVSSVQKCLSEFISYCARMIISLYVYIAVMISANLVNTQTHIQTTFDRLYY